MKHIKIVFPELGLGSCFQALVYLKEVDNDWSMTTKTYNRELEICLEENKVYFLYAVSSLGTINYYFYVDQKRDNYFFPFCNSIITFQVTDFYYKNLPIEKGEISLWKKT